MNNNEPLPIVQIDNLVKIYKLYNNPTDRFKEAIIPFGRKRHIDFYALNNISLTINKGETVGIIGRNGSGKSTLLKVITGVLTQSFGSVVVNGKISALLELGAGFNPEFTGRENIYMNGIINGFTKEEIAEKIDSIIEFADIGDFIDQPVKIYSSGMFARLGFAVAINVEPDILIVDEALSVGDMSFQLKCFKKFNEFKEKGKTIVFVSHDLATVLKICDRAILLSNGNILYDGSVGEAINKYKELLAGNILKNIDSKHKVINDLYRNHMNNNKEISDYGNYKAKIIDYGIFDSKGNLSSVLMSNETSEIVIKVVFNTEIDEPIFAFTVKDLNGADICGTNTLYESVATETFKSGEVVTVRFKQRLMLQQGKYVISFGCTKFIDNKLEIFNRLYDACFLEILSDKHIVGCYDIDSDIIIYRDLEC